MTMKEEEELRFGRRVYAKPSKQAGSKLFPSYGGMSSRAMAEKYARGAPEAMLKFDKASVKDGHHLQEAARYITRNGKLDCEDQDGQSLDGCEVIDDRMQDWTDDEDLQKRAGQGRPSKTLARRFIISTPPGTSVEALKKAVREFAQTELRDNGFDYIWTIHTDKAHPHAHILIKDHAADGHRLHYSLQELKALRERWCVVAEKYGIDLNATSRAVRGHTRRDKPIERVYQEKRGSRHIYEEYRIEELAKYIKSGGDLAADEPELMQRCRMTRAEIIRNAGEYAEELRQTGKPEDLALADAISRKIQALRPVESAQEERLRKAKDKIAKKRQQRTAAEKARAEQIKEIIRQRKAVEAEAARQAEEQRRQEEARKNRGWSR